jgi:hypothetical protein
VVVGYSPPRADARPAWQREPAFHGNREGYGHGPRTGFFRFLPSGALLEALAVNGDRAPDGLQHGRRHGAPPAQGLMAPERTL